MMDPKKLQKALYHLKTALKETKEIKSDIDMAIDRETYILVSNWDVAITRTLGEIELARIKEIRLIAREKKQQ